MSRIQVLLAVVAGLLVAALFFFLVWQPKQEELELVEADIDMVIAEQQQLTTERNRLRSVRENAPEIEADLRAAEAVVPTSTDIPAVLRQLQLAADDAGIVLRSISPQRAEQLPDAEPGLSVLAVGVQVEGTYFQIVDFVRRIEDPSMTPRGLLWDGLTMSIDEFPGLGESPTLITTLSGQLYARLPAPPPEETEEADEGADGETDVEVNGDTDDTSDTDEQTPEDEA
jgi:Tfp pilus assembly protein PilO